MKMISKTLFILNLCLGKQCKACEKEIRKQLMSVAWRPTRWLDCCLSEDEQKEIEPILVSEK